MPKGVEHLYTGELMIPLANAFPSVMPKGVEHHQNIERMVSQKEGRFHL